MMNKAGYMATEVACGWAGAVMTEANQLAEAKMQKPPVNAEKANCYRLTIRLTEGYRKIKLSVVETQEMLIKSFGIHLRLFPE